MLFIIEAYNGGLDYYKLIFGVSFLSDQMDTLFVKICAIVKLTICTKTALAGCQHLHGRH